MITSVLSPSMALLWGVRDSDSLTNWQLPIQLATHFNNWDQQQQRLSNPNPSCGQAPQDPHYGASLQGQRWSTGMCFISADQILNSWSRQWKCLSKLLKIQSGSRWWWMKWSVDSRKEEGQRMQYSQSGTGRCRKVSNTEFAQAPICFRQELHETANRRCWKASWQRKKASILCICWPGKGLWQGAQRGNKVGFEESWCGGVVGELELKAWAQLKNLAHIPVECVKGVGNNSNRCSKWVHRWCISVKGSCCSVCLREMHEGP